MVLQICLVALVWSRFDIGVDFRPSLLLALGSGG